ncbi:hypothetical protein KRR39_10880 [Nocardioides panacis]|uniref:Cobyrinic acid a,c-diamide synthase n=2 Tax=Nocardioides panacis TaxID=2849501 RepID=A0A975Y279_9ACTN|nr:hypothetical protein [Nocardioides panacis]QWZ10189.1 hypothetical protein KRR39_10880 [Nocardioides panacis]
MSRRVSMPAADDLFRPTVVPDHTVADPEGDDGDQPAEGKSAKKGPSGRVRHDEKMTVYVTADELLDIEHARLTLRRSGLSVDRGRLVREAVALVLADLEQNGDDSVLAQRLMQA